MFEFFIALFGGIYWISRISAYKTREKVDKIQNEITQAYRSAITDEHRAPLQLIEELDRRIKLNLPELQKEFHDDLVYIYGEYFISDQNSLAKRRNWYYSVPEAIRHLILARDYKQMERFVIGYSTGVYPEQAKYSIRLFKRMNEYIEDEQCQLTLCPYFNGTEKGWSIYYADFKPAVWNLYADYPQAKMSSWAAYC